MKILFFGRGVISTQYGWALEKSGNEVEFYVRPGRSAHYGPSVNLNVLDGRTNSKGDEIKEIWPVTMRETLDDNYDLIVISVNHNQLEEAAKLVGKNTKNATVLIFNNIWEDPKTIESYFPQGHVLWGFPGAGGGYVDAHTLHGGLLKSVFLQAEKTAPSLKRYKQVTGILEKAGFSIIKQKNMRDWLWGHFILNVGIFAVAMKVGGAMKANESLGDVREQILIMRELVPLIKAKGGKPDFLTKLITTLPVWIIARLLQKMSAPGTMGGEIIYRVETSGHSTPQMNYDYIKEVIPDSEKYNIPLPRLMALEPFFTPGYRADM